jgi:hypothetical protein
MMPLSILRSALTALFGLGKSARITGADYQNPDLPVENRVDAMESRSLPMPFPPRESP